MELVYKRADGKPGIQSKNSFVMTAPSALHHFNNFDDIIDDICKSVTDYGNTKKMRVGSQNFRNARGRWFEWLLNYLVWDFFASSNSTLRMINLPNADKFECTNLYLPKYSEHIGDLKKKLQVQDIELVTSNPDFVLIDTANLDIDIDQIFDVNNPQIEDLDFFDNFYNKFIGKCDLNDLQGYVSVKTSTRSDRRFQWLHEGNLAKSLHLHIRTREWLTTVRSLKFFCMSYDLKPKDVTALKTATTHTIASIGLKPEKSVDNAFKVINSDELNDALQVMVDELDKECN